MRHDLLERLRCPACGTDGAFELEARRGDAAEVRDGTVRCGSCATQFGVRDGIVDLLPDPPPHIAREAEGLARFAELMRADGWDCERIRQLPYVDLPYWWGQRRAYEYWSQQIRFEPGERLLDIGANTCWASALFAQLGLSVIALDISAAELQGLRSAECFIRDGSLFFERVLSTMTDPAIASGTMDYVFCCEALHHNDRAAMRRTLLECHRVLRPGGCLLVVNEPLRFPLNLKRGHGSEVAEFEGNEHVYFLHEYVLAARRAGFAVSVRLPRNVPRPARDAEPPLRPPSSGLRGFARSAPFRRAHAAWKLAVAGDVSLNMLCRKSESG
jgi:SAM-dependent methyltransferase